MNNYTIVLEADVFEGDPQGWDGLRREHRVEIKVEAESPKEAAIKVGLVLTQAVKAHDQVQVLIANWTVDQAVAEPCFDPKQIGYKALLLSGPAMNHLSDLIGGLIDGKQSELRRLVQAVGQPFSQYAAARMIISTQQLVSASCSQGWNGNLVLAIAALWPTNETAALKAQHFPFGT